MTSALLYVTFCSVRNRIRVRFRRLKQPRYALGLIVGLLYFGFLIFQPSRRRNRGLGAGVLPGLGRIRGGIEVCGGAAMLGLIALSWLYRRAQPALHFTAAEVQFLFTAPVTRRSLIRYKIIRTQLASALGLILMTLVLRPPSATAGLIFFLGMLLVSATLSLHFTGVSLRQESLFQHGRAGLRRQALPIATVWLALAIVVGTLAANWTALRSVEGMGALFTELERLGSTGAAGVVLWPFRMLVRLPLAGTWPEFLATLPFVLAMLAANYFWVIRSDTAFEEASARRAEEQARIAETPIAPRRWGSARGEPSKPGRSSPTPFGLRLRGPAETALLWKNLILLSRFASLKFVLPFLPMVIVMGVILSQVVAARGLSDALTFGALGIAGIAIAVGPYIVRNDLRADLTKLAILKTWPVRGGALVRGEILAPAVLLSAIVWIAIAAALALSSPTTFGGQHGLLVRLTWAIAAVLAAPGLIAAQLVVHNGMALLFPAWVRLGPRRSRGIDTMGQMMLLSLAMSFLVLVALIPALVVAGVVGGSIYRVTGTIPALIPAAAAGAALLAECALATELLGGMFDRMDISEVEAQEA